MLTEFQRRVYIADLVQNVNYTLGTWDVNPKIFRYGEGFDQKHPYVAVQFLPASRDKFRSLSNYIGKADNSLEYNEFGWCQLENVVIRAYCHEQSQRRTIPGRLVAEFIIRQIQIHILKYWDLLCNFSHACLDDIESINFVDRTIYDKPKASKIYIYELNFYLRTQFRWDELPEDFGGDVLIDEVKVLTLNDGENQGPIIY